MKRAERPQNEHAVGADEQGQISVQECSIYQCAHNQNGKHDAVEIWGAVFQAEAGDMDERIKMIKITFMSTGQGQVET